MWQFASSFHYIRTWLTNLVITHTEALIGFANIQKQCVCISLSMHAQPRNSDSFDKQCQRQTIRGGSNTKNNVVCINNRCDILLNIVSVIPYVEGSNVSILGNIGWYLADDIFAFCWQEIVMMSANYKVHGADWYSEICRATYFDLSLPLTNNHQLPINWYFSSVTSGLFPL